MISDKPRVEDVAEKVVNVCSVPEAVIALADRTCGRDATTALRASWCGGTRLCSGAVLVGGALLHGLGGPPRLTVSRSDVRMEKASSSLMTVPTWPPLPARVPPIWSTWL